MEEIQQTIERRYLQCILDLTRSGQITRKEVTLSARVIQAMRPWNDWQEVALKTEFFVSKFPLFSAMHEFAVQQLQEQQRKRIIDKMHEHLKANNIDGALAVANNS